MRVRVLNSFLYPHPWRAISCHAKPGQIRDLPEHIAATALAGGFVELAPEPVVEPVPMLDPAPAPEPVPEPVAATTTRVSRTATATVEPVATPEV